MHQRTLRNAQIEERAATAASVVKLVAKAVLYIEPDALHRGDIRAVNHRLEMSEGEESKVLASWRRV